MSLTTIAGEAAAAKTIWDAMGGNSKIDWVLENYTTGTLTSVGSHKNTGKWFGSWENINADTGGTALDALEVGTEGTWGGGNNGGVIYEISKDFYMALVWSDPGTSAAYYGYFFGDRLYVTNQFNVWAYGYFTAEGCEISACEIRTVNTPSVIVKFHPNFDVFKITFKPNTSSELSTPEDLTITPVAVAESSSESANDREQAADQFERMGKALLDSSNRLRER